MLFDYTVITPESIEAGLNAALAQADQLIGEVVAAEGPRTFENTLAPAERAAQIVAVAYGRGPFLGEAAADEAVREAARALEEKLAKWGVDLVFRQDVHEAIAAYAATDEATSLTGERARLLEFMQRDFRMAGHELSPEQRTELKRHNERLVELSILFSTNIAEYEDYLVVTRADLDGLPDSYIESLKPGEKADTFCVSMAYPDVVPFIENVKNRKLREALQKKFSNRAAEANRPVIEEAVELRQKIADIFEVDSWAHHSMQLKMAKTPEAVFDFYDSIVPGLTAQARAEIARMRDLLHADTGAEELELWDWRYY
ncbi:MAG: M3 family metallopeptidase, partial [Acidimicrobiia bacterium]|nr:M3 family metallopeptidase [Acidimicrobiia bacterium]